MSKRLWAEKQKLGLIVGAGFAFNLGRIEAWLDRELRYDSVGAAQKGWDFAGARICPEDEVQPGFENPASIVLSIMAAHQGEVVPNHRKMRFVAMEVISFIR